MKNVIIFSLLLCGLWACTDKKIDTAKAKAIIEASQPKRVLPEQIVAQVDEWGKLITDSLNKDYQKSFTKPFMREHIKEEFKVDLRFFGLQDVKDKTLDDKTRQVLEAYQYNAEHHLPQSDNIQKIDKGDTTFYLYTLPVAINEQLLKVDSLKTRKKGDLFGIWGILFSKKEVIKKINVKHLKDLKVER